MTAPAVNMTEREAGLRVKPAVVNPQDDRDRLCAFPSEDAFSDEQSERHSGPAGTRHRFTPLAVRLRSETTAHSA